MARTRSASGAQAAVSPVGRFHARGFDVFFSARGADGAGDLAGRLTEFIGATAKTLECANDDLHGPAVVAVLKGVLAAGRTPR